MQLMDGYNRIKKEYFSYQEKRKDYFTQLSKKNKLFF